MITRTKGEAVPKDYSEVVVDAAIRCINKFGIEKTTIEDIAKEAKLGRTTVYRTYRNRNEILDAILLKRVKEIGEELAPIFSSYKSFDECLIKGSIITIKYTRQNKVLFTLIEHATDRGVDHFFVSPDSPVQELTLALYGPAFRSARKQGLLRKDLNDKDLATWLRAVHLILFLRDDLDERGQARFLKKFLVRSIIS